MTIFFSHIPKNGGMTLRFFLRNQFSNELVCPYDTWRPEILMGAKTLAQYHLFQGHMHYDLVKKIPTTDVICMFREPVARTLSLLQHLRRDPKFHPLHTRAVGKSIREMLFDPLISAHLANQQTSYLGALIDYSKLESAFAIDGQIDVGEYFSHCSLKLALERLESLALVGLTEAQGETMNRLSKQFGFHPNLEYAKRNSAQGDEHDSIQSLSKDVLERIRELNHLDIVLYEAAQTRFYGCTEVFSYDYLVRSSLSKGDVMYLDGDRFDLWQPLRGTNWYEPENSEGGAAYRWSGPNALSSIEFPLEVESYEVVTIQLFPRGDDDLTTSLTLIVDGEEIGHPNHLQDRTYVIDLLMRPNVISKEKGYHQVLFRHEPTKIDLSPRNADLRDLHFGLSAVKLFGSRNNACQTPFAQNQLDQSIGGDSGLGFLAQYLQASEMRMNQLQECSSYANNVQLNIAALQKSLTTISIQDDVIKEQIIALQQRTRCAD